MFQFQFDDDAPAVPRPSVHPQQCRREKRER